MKEKIPMILFQVVLVALLALGTLAPGQAMAVPGEMPQILPPDGEDCIDFVIDGPGLTTYGNSGDPDSAGDGLEFLDPDLLAYMDGLINDQEQFVALWAVMMMEQLCLTPQMP
jgi:hypothetical protein